MIKDIWHTTEQKPEDDKNIAFYVDGCLYSGYYKPEHNQYGIFGASKVEKWCYTRELSSYILALEKENEAMREEFEVWHENYKCEVEEKKRLQKALDLAVGALKRIKEPTAWGSLYQEQEIATDALETIGKI